MPIGKPGSPACPRRSRSPRPARRPQPGISGLIDARLPSPASTGSWLWSGHTGRRQDRATRIDGLPGLWSADGSRVSVTASAEDALFVEGVAVDGVRLLDPDLALDPTVLFHDGRKLVPIIREGLLALRIYDPEAENRRTFAGIERYSHDPALVFAARYEPYVHGHVEKVLNADGRERGLELHGDLVFEHEDAEYRLAATREDDLFDVTFGDATNGPDTFGFRQLSAAAPESGGTTVLDFNRAQLPPCAFSDHFICSLPPVGNRLPLAVAAGEKRRKVRS